MKQNEIEQIKEELRELLPAGSKVYTQVVHVSRSGMSRHIDVFAIKDNTPIKINWQIEKLGLFKRGSSYNAKNADSLRVGGCGMDMGFHVVYNLSSVLYRDGFKCSGKNCPSNDHFNDPEFKRRKGKQHKGDGGYALKQVWL